MSEVFTRQKLNIKEAKEFIESKDIQLKCILAPSSFFTTGKVYKAKPQLIGDVRTSYKGYWLETDDPTYKSLRNAWELSSHFELLNL